MPSRQPTEPAAGAIADLMLRPQVKWRWRESNPLLLGASEVLCHQSFIPRVLGLSSSGGDDAPPEPSERDV